MSRGVVYFASGPEYIEKAETSADSLRTHNPNLPITLYTEQPVDSAVFDEVKLVDANMSEKGDSILSRDHVCYDKNLFLDADTYVADDITDVFELLDRFDIVAAHNEARAWYHAEVYERAGVNLPACFPEYNTGVVGYNDSRHIRRLFENWNERYEQLNYERNQPAFRIALYESDVNIGTLPPEYNFMTHTIGFASGDVKILHQGPSEENLAEWKKRLNSVPGKKVTSWEDTPCRVIPNTYKSRRYRIKSLDRKRLAEFVAAAREKRRNEGTHAVLSSAGDKVRRFITGTK